MLTLLEVLKRTEGHFRKFGVESPRLDAEWLLAHVLGIGRLDLYLQFERPMEERHLEVLRPLVRRRAAREPLQYVLHETSFHGLVLKTDRRALIPRPETERLVELILEKTSRPPRRFLDLGTGTGALALALLARWTESEAVATDTSDAALALARENAEALGATGRISLRRSDWFRDLPGDEVFDLIVSNPPYLTECEWAAAAPEVREFEPRGALVAAGDGCAALREIVAGASARLVPGGLLAVETGIHHHDTLAAFGRKGGFACIESVRDYHDRDRYLFLRKPGEA